MKNHAIRQTLHFFQGTALLFVLFLGGLMGYDAWRNQQPLKEGLAQLELLKTLDLEDSQRVQTIRDLDYLYRSVYFQTKDRQAYGFLLLGVGFLSFCAALGTEWFLFPPKLNVPQTSAAVPEQERKQTLYFSLGAVSVLIFTVVAVRMTTRSTFEEEISPNSTPVVASAELPMEKPIEKTAISPPGEKIDSAAAMEEETHQWAQFRGSVLPNQNPLPAAWKFREKWRVPIPLEGFNSPIVWGDRVFVAGGNEQQRAIFCFDAPSGKKLWETECQLATRYPELTDDTGVSAPTLCADRNRVCAIFATGELLCCDHDGKILWQKLLPFPEISYGYASSLLLVGEKLIVQYDLNSSQTLYALDVTTGNEIWKADRESTTSWSTPIALWHEGRLKIFVTDSLSAELFDGQTGESLWKQECMGGEVATTSSASAGILYLSNTGAMTGAISAKDGEILFRNDNVPAPDVASPVLFGDVFLLFSSGGSVIALDAATGEELYEEEFDNGFYASPVVIQEKMVGINLDGELLLMTATKEKMTVEGRFALEQKVVAIPAMYRGNVIVRTFENELVFLETQP